MIPLTKLKKDVLFNTELTHVIDVLKGIAAARFHILERQLSIFEQFFQTSESFLNMLDIEAMAHPFVREQTQTASVILVTSDAGFLGGLNSQVVGAGLRQAGPGAVVTLVGERGLAYLRDSGRSITAFPGIQDGSRLSMALAVRNHVIQQVLSGQCGRLLIAYPRPSSMAVQKVVVETLLPCTAWPSRKEAPRVVRRRSMIWESEPQDVMEYVMIQWIGHRLNEIFALARLAELGARVVHLEGSYQELLRRGKRLKQDYFRARHEVIDRSMREIFAAQLLYKKQHETHAAVGVDDAS